jgi:hypothetical protein
MHNEQTAIVSGAIGSSLYRLVASTPLQQLNYRTLFGPTNQVFNTMSLSLVREAVHRCVM